MIRSGHGHGAARRTAALLALASGLAGYASMPGLVGLYRLQGTVRQASNDAPSKKARCHNRCDRRWYDLVPSYAEVDVAAVQWGLLEAFSFVSTSQ
jgi:hypothetical protein